ncbi:MAG: ATP-binding protein [Treponema sp.]|nr:ATP-binding protein [Treponema sp.]
MNKALVLVFVLVLLGGCTDNVQEQQGFSMENISFTDIPGITLDEIRAIEDLQSRGLSFAVSGPLSTELFIDEYGEHGGYLALLSEWLSSVFGLDFYPRIEGLGTIAQLLYAGDPFFAMQAITEGRSLSFYLSETIAQRSVRMMRLPESRSIVEISQSRLPRFIFLEGAMMIDHFADSEEPFIIAEDYEEAYRMLLNGEADAFVGSNIMEVAFDSFGGVVTEDFFPLTFIPIALATGNPELRPIISILNKALLSGAYNHLTEIYRQGYEQYRRHRFTMLLTEEERAYIRTNPEIPFATQYQSYPISFFNRHENRWEGAVFEVLDEMTQLSGLSFRLVNAPDTELPELMNLLEAGTAFFIPNLVQSDERRERFIWPSTMYINDRYALLSKRSFPNIELNDIPFARVGLHTGSAFTDMFRSWFPNAVNAVEYPSSAASFAALDRGEVDLVMSTQSRLSTMTNLYELSDYKANFLFNAAFEASFGINRDQVILLSIVDKALLLIDTNRIMEQWQSITYDYQARLMREQRPWLIGLVILTICVLVLVSVLLTLSRSTGKKLEKLVRQRTIELEQRTEEADAASRSKTAFLANMSHEMRTPMNVVVGLTDLMLEEEDPSVNFKANLKKISTAGNTLLGLINDVLDISKIEAGKLELMPVKYEVPSLLNDIIALNLIRIEDKPIKFNLDINENLLCNLYGDDLRVKQIINNLLSNAFKYTQRGFVKLGISIVHEGGSEVLVSIYISDTGIGIREEDLKKLFADYGQVDTRTNRMIEGTGLGLSITKRLVGMMNGEISAESEHGKGSVFRVTFRQGYLDNTVIGPDVAENLRKIRYSEDKRSDKKKLVRADLSHARVLVVDDMQTNLDVASGLLRKYMMQVDCVLSGPEAIERLRQSDPVYNAVFMDHMMPGMDGIETTAAIRSLGTEYAAKIPIIALTANAIQGMEELFYSHDFQAFLPKPIDIRLLDSVVKRWIPDKSRNGLET